MPSEIFNDDTMTAKNDAKTPHLQLNEKVKLSLLDLGANTMMTIFPFFSAGSPQTDG